MKIIIFAFCIIQLQCQNLNFNDLSQTDEQLFEEFKRKFTRKYKTPSEITNILKLKQEPTFKSPDGKVLLGTAPAARFMGDAPPPKPYQKAINDFADLTDQEFQSFYLLPQNILYSQSQSYNTNRFFGRFLQDNIIGNLQRKINWKNQNKVSPVKFQSRCNSCYAFTVTAALEAHQMIKNNSMKPLSEQEILDCDSKNFECKGGQPGWAFDYIINNSISYDRDYPYIGKKNTTCYKDHTTIPNFKQGRRLQDNSQQNQSQLGAFVKPFINNKWQNNTFNNRNNNNRFNNNRFNKNRFNNNRFNNNRFNNNRFNNNRYNNNRYNNNRWQKPQQTWPNRTWPNKTWPNKTWPNQTWPTNPPNPPNPPPTYPPNPPPTYPPNPPTPTYPPNPPTPTPPTPPPKPQRAKFNNLQSYRQINKNIVDLLKELKNGPVVVALYVSEAFKFYSSGIFDGEGCQNINTVNHTVLLIGYDLDSKIPYMELKNSWGTKWGDNGYFKIKIGDITFQNNGLCLIAGTQFNMIPVLKQLKIQSIKLIILFLQRQ